MAAPIQSPAKCEVHSVIRFLNANVERPVEIHKQIVAVYGNVTNFHLFLHLKKHLAGKKFDDDDEVQEEVMTRFKGLAADFYDYVQAIHSQCRFCKLKMLYMFKTFVSLHSGHALYVHTLTTLFTLMITGGLFLSAGFQ